ncbi:MAG: hypothetical protein U1F30_13495 [Steroidobacteraceae bacterium]
MAGDCSPAAARRRPQRLRSLRQEPVRARPAWRAAHRRPGAENADLRGNWRLADTANLAGANAKWAHFEERDTRADADLFHAIFDYADLAGAQFGGAYLFSANTSSTRVPPE